MRICVSLAALAATLAGCATMPPPDPARGIPVTASGQTQPVASRDDAADDPAIWVNSANPAESLIVGTDKQAGLYVYGLDGTVRAFAEAGRVNNVDLVDGVSFGGEEAVIVAASDRNDIANAHVALYRLNTDPVALEPILRVPAGPGEGYGFCMALMPEGELFAFVNTTQGSIYQMSIALEGTAVSGTVRTMTVPSQPEGCVVDPRTNSLYVGEEAAGIWRFDLATGRGTLVVQADGARLVPDVEGLALAPQGADGGYLVASSQGDSAYAVYALPDYRYVGRFYVADGNGIDGTTETDGIAISTANLGPQFPGGLMVVQDGMTPAGTQNFKLIDWRAIRAALGLD
ncbi:phytase [Parasphingopyxis marina]|uniref:Phytase n=1 Tax=Parasphingopyxis marina TaxID=2761622 RepID=A0A842I105_9SPHN|nr:phytase [Parasphingopyxis marina]MBC2778339.1 phytase [Parasphingopyxis marina]